MNSRTYINKILLNLVEKFPDVKLLYDFDDLGMTHVIKVVPDKILRSPDFSTEKADITLNFIELFPYEGITFIGENDLIDIEDPIYEIQGSEYMKPKAVNRSVWVEGNQMFIDIKVYFEWVQDNLNNAINIISEIKNPLTDHQIFALESKPKFDDADLKTRQSLAA